MKTKNNSGFARTRKKSVPASKGSYVKPTALLNARGLRSRERLKEAARVVLNEKGYHSLRVQDITERAGVANGLFYRYFHDLREIVAEICSDFFDRLVGAGGTLEVGDEPYDWIYQNHRDVVERFARNPGVLAVLFGLAGDYEEFASIWQRNAHDWNLQVAEFLQSSAGFERSHAERMGFVLGAMIEGVIYQALIRHTDDLFEFGGKPEDIAEISAVMWYRTIFLDNPPLDLLRETGKHLAGESLAKKNI